MPFTQPENEKHYWKHCSSCKKEISYHANYQVCSVSTCRSKKTGLIFCSIPCWDAHLGFANHRDASAEEHRAPSKEEYMNEVKNEQIAGDHHEQRKIIASGSSSSSPLKDIETLVVVSKVKGFIRQASSMNTSQCAIDALTQHVADTCLKAIEKAKVAGRKTVMGRDFEE